MAQAQTLQPSSQFHVEVIDNTTYEVTSNYTGDMTLLDLFKLMIKRDVEKLNH